MQKISFTEHAYERYRERALGDPLRLERSIREIRSIIQSSLERHSCYSLLEKLAAHNYQIRINLSDSDGASLGSCTLVLSKRPSGGRCYKATSIV